MKKRAYKATPIRRINAAELSSVCRDKKVIVGVDVAKEEPVAAFMLEDGQVVRTVKWKHPFETRYFLGVLNAIGNEQVVLVLEPTGTYADALVNEARSRGIDVWMAKPKHVKDMHEIYDGVDSKHDGKDAAVVGELQRIGKTSQWRETSPARRRAKALLSLVDIHRDQFLANVSRLEAMVARHWPELTEILKLKAAATLAILAKYGGPDHVVRDREGLKLLAWRASCGGVRTEVADEVVRSATNTLGVPMLEEEIEMLKAIAAEADRNRKELRKAEKRVEECTRDNEPMNGMAHKVGRVTAAVLVAFVGDPGEFESAHAYQKACGLNLKIRESGRDKYRHKRLRITKRGPGAVRKYLYLAVLRQIQCDAVFKAYYVKKVARDGGVKGKAITALMRKLIQGLWHAGQNKRFDSSLLFDVSRLGLSQEPAT